MLESVPMRKYSANSLFLRSSNLAIDLAVSTRPIIPEVLSRRCVKTMAHARYPIIVLTYYFSQCSGNIKITLCQRGTSGAVQVFQFSTIIILLLLP